MTKESNRKLQCAVYLHRYLRPRYLIGGYPRIATTIAIILDSLKAYEERVNVFFNEQTRVTIILLRPA